MTINPLAGIVWNPSYELSRRFALRTLLVGLGVILLCTLLLMHLLPHCKGLLHLRLGMTIVAAWCLVGLLLPVIIRPLYWLLEGCLALLQFAISGILLGLFYYLILAPIGLVMRLARRDPLRLRKPAGGSLWVEHPPSPSPARYYRQY